MNSNMKSFVMGILPGLVGRGVLPAPANQDEKAKE